MRGIKWSRSEIIMISSAAIVAVLSFISLHMVSVDSLTLLSLKSGEVIGHIVPMGNDVRVRRSEQVDWTFLQKDIPVYHQDRLFTGDDSKARVEFKNKAAISVVSNSLILIEAPSNGEPETISINAGGFFTDLNKTASIRFKQGDKISYLSASKDQGIVKIVKDEKSGMTQMTVLKGQVDIQTDKKIEQIKENETVKVNNVGEIVEKTKFAIELFSPSPLTSVYYQQKREVVLRWKADSRIKAYRVMTSPTPDFHTILSNKVVEKNEASVEPPEQWNTIYWKVQGEKWEQKNKKFEAFSPVSEFTIVELRKPLLIAPISQQQLAIESLSNDGLTFSWRDLTGSSDFELKLAHDSGMRDIYKKVKTNNGSFTMTDIEAGTYYWQVSTSPPGAEKTILSDTSIFTILPPVRKISSEETTTTTVSTTTTLETVAADEQVMNQPAEPLPEPTTTSTSTTTTSSTTTTLVSAILSAPDIAQNYVHEISEGKESFELRWKSIPGSMGYHVLVSRVEDFGQTEKDMAIREEKLFLNNLDIGEYYIRLASINNQGKEGIASTAKLRVLLRPPVLQKVKSLPWDELADQGVLQLQFDSYHSNNYNVGKNYEVQISSDKLFKNIVSKNNYSTEIKKIGFSQGGVFYIRIRTLNSEFWPISLFSNIEKFEMVKPPPPPPVVEKEEEKPQAEQQVVEKKEGKAQEEVKQVEQRKEERRLEKPIEPTLFWLSGGTLVSQNAESGAIYTPTFVGDFGFQFYKRWSFQYSYRNMPVSVSASNVTKEDSSVNHSWTVTDYQLKYWMTDQYSPHKGQVFVSMQEHKIPMVYAKSSGNNATSSIDMKVWGLGVQYDFYRNEKWFYELTAAVRNPYSKSSPDGTLSLTAPTSFDGSVGAVRKLNDRWQVGFYWFTQYYDLKYDFVPSDVSGSATGGIEGFSSHIQIRLGYEFLSGFFVLPAGGAWAWRRRKKRSQRQNLNDSENDILNDNENDGDDKSADLKNNKTSRTVWVSSDKSDQILIIFLWLFALYFSFSGAKILNFHSHSMASFNEQRAFVIRDFINQWINDSAMSDRIKVKEITIQQGKEHRGSAVAAVQVVLTTDEQFDKNYQNQLIGFLSLKAKSETGIDYHFNIQN